MVGRCADERSQTNSIAIVDRRTEVRRAKDADENLNGAPTALFLAGEPIACKGRAIPMDRPRGPNGRVTPNQRLNLTCPVSLTGRVGFGTAPDRRKAPVNLSVTATIEARRS